MSFIGSQLRLARIFNELSLEDLAVKVGKTRQYIHKLETGQSEPTDELLANLANSLAVLPNFFSVPPKVIISEQDFHFRKLFTTRTLVKHTAMAKAEIFGRLVAVLEAELKFPSVNIPTLNDINGVDDIERAAEHCRSVWGLGLGPISNMTRLAENVGAIVTSFQSVSSEVDALSIELHRPVIVRNEAKKSVCRQRFDIAHEIGHFVLHEGQVTGDRITESQANRFASALLIPKEMMLKLFPKLKNNRLDWRGISDFKLQWKVSKAALLYRAHQLNIINDQQYKSGVITLKRTGEALQEKEDYRIATEEPELLINSVRLLHESYHVTAQKLAAMIDVDKQFISEFLPEIMTSEFDIPTNLIVMSDFVKDK